MSVRSKLWNEHFSIPGPDALFCFVLFLIFVFCFSHSTWFQELECLVLGPQGLEVFAPINASISNTFRIYSRTFWSGNILFDSLCVNNQLGHCCHENVSWIISLHWYCKQASLWYFHLPFPLYSGMHSDFSSRFLMHSRTLQYLLGLQPLICSLIFPIFYILLLFLLMTLKFKLISIFINLIHIFAFPAIYVNTKYYKLYQNQCKI
jgi:hypothetical protein